MHDVVADGMNEVVTGARRRDVAVDWDTERQLKDRSGARSRWVGRLFAFGAFLALAGGLALGGARAYSQHHEVIATAQRQHDFVPTVRVATVRASPSHVAVSLPGTTAAFADANIYARATGYIETRNVDIGDHVKAGDLLAQLAVPELDHQIAQNEATLGQLRAALQQAQANLNLAEVTWGRDKPLVRDGWVTQQQGTVDVDTVKAQQAAVGVAQANIIAQENELKVLRQQKDYASVVAPFDGVITQRNVDLGSLVQGNATSGTFMFTIMQSNLIRVWVYVPQDAAFGLRPGVDAVVRVPEIPGRPFPGRVTRIAEALQTGTRTLLTEIDIPNPDGTLQPGTYCTVELDIPRQTPSLLLPADATIFNQNGLQVAVVDDGVVHIRRISVTRDLGTEVEVNDGVRQGDQVIINPPVTLVEGSKVRTRVEPVAANLVGPATSGMVSTRVAEAAIRSSAARTIGPTPGHGGQHGDAKGAGIAASALCEQDCIPSVRDPAGPRVGPVARAGAVSGNVVTVRSDPWLPLAGDRQPDIQDMPSSVRQEELTTQRRELDRVLDRVIRNICRGC
jgi:RND family efflux transporter MFP subunit